MNHEPEALHDLDRVLTALNRATPRDGMEQRILARLHQREVLQPAPQPWSFVRLLLPACAALILCIAFALHHTRSQPANRLEAGSSQLEAGSVLSSSRAPELKTQSSKLKTEQALFSSHAETHQSITSAVAASRTTAPLCDCDPVALADTQAPSHPAPPMPLTAQEKLMLRMVRRDSPVLVAELDTRQSEASLARERDEVRQLLAALVPEISHAPEPPAPEPSISAPDDAPAAAPDPSSTSPSTNGDSQ